MAERDHDTSESSRPTLTLGRRAARTATRASASSPVTPAGTGNRAVASITKPVAYVDPRPPLPDAGQVVRPGPQPGDDLDLDTTAPSRSLLDGDTHDLDDEELEGLSVVDQPPGRIDPAAALPPLLRLLTAAKRLRNGAADHADMGALLDDLLERIEASIAEADAGLEPEHYVDLYSTKRTIERTIYERSPEYAERQEKKASEGEQPKRRRDPDADPPEVRIQMHDPARRKEVMEWLEAETAPLAELPGGELLRSEMLKAHDVDELVLGRSMRSSDRPEDTLMGREESRPLVFERVLNGDIPDGAYRVEFLDACVGHGVPGKDENPDWPYTSAGVPWEVDHVLELWQGGADDPSNFLALHPALHALKTEIMDRFRGEFLYKRRHAD
jgi:hypothetical protein